VTDHGPLAIPADLEATLVLVRHGESELIVQRRFQGQAETPLSATGRRQAELVARRLARPLASPALPLPAGLPLAIVHSPLGRASETAAAIQEAMEAGDGFSRPIPRRSDDRLRGERLDEVRSRVRPALADLVAELSAAARPGPTSSPVAGYRDRPSDQPWTVVVGHDGVFKVLLLTLFDLPLERFWMWSSDLCGISVIELQRGRAVIRAMNLTEHLASLRDQTAQAEAESRTRSGAL